MKTNKSKLKISKKIKTVTLTTLVPLFLLSSGCSVVSNVPISEKKPGKTTQPEPKSSESGQKNNLPKNDKQGNQSQNSSDLVKKPEPGNQENQKKQDLTDKNLPNNDQNQKKDNQKPDSKLEKVEPPSKPKKEEKNESFSPPKKGSIPVDKKMEEKNQQNTEKKLVDDFDPYREQKNFDAELAQLKGHLSILPTAFQISKTNLEKNAQTLIYNGNNSLKDLPFNIINPINGLDEEKYKIKLDFSEATSKEKTKNQFPIERVKLVLFSKTNSNISFWKYVSLFYNKIESSFELKAKLPAEFNNIFPSFVAFLLLNKDKNDVISLPFFNDLGFILKDRNFGVGLKNDFVDLKASDSEKDKYEYNFEIVSAQPDDKSGKLKLNLQIWRVAKNSNTDNKEFFPEISTVEITGFAKNSNKEYKFEVAERGKFEQKLSDLELKKKLSENDLNSEFTKNRFLKLLFENLHIRINQNLNMNEKWIEVAKLRADNWLIYPQIQYLNLDSTKFIQNLTLTREDNKINWKFELNTYLLSKNQTLTPQSRDYLLGEKKTHVIQGSFDLEKNKNS
ncbi:mycoides cluster lipoprotein, LppA/P72 family [Mesomycoplasma dispar]|uniref:Mycoides cluster lipoprotein, LppA/P72 family n=1 Tax=Mesomycoplasma dispar TaxID=86660 RepID=A0AAJ5TD36_9BACT|nr:hypothetical protein [Mesomycoplasma dispar]VEU62741.1 mycoides cluster lipoprotein, LppA/P72 family [Mesomycoplasma dispar]